MGKIGLIDHDAIISPSTFYWDLSIMKLAGYYKSEKKLTRLLYSMPNIDEYEKVYLVKNKHNYKIDSNFLFSPKLECSGYAFSRGLYFPFDYDIENAIPDTSIYDDYLSWNRKIPQRTRAKIYNRAKRDANHARLSTDNVTCNVADCNIVYNKSPIIVLHDRNALLYEDVANRLKDFKNKRIEFRFAPIGDLDTILDITTNLQITSENHFIINNITTKEELDRLIELGKTHKDRYKIQFFQKAYEKTEEEIIEEAIQALKVCLYVKSFKQRTHGYVSSYDLTKELSYLIGPAYWMSECHSDSSLLEFYNDVKFYHSLICWKELGSKNSEISELMNIRPSKYKGGNPFE